MRQRTADPGKTNSKRTEEPEGGHRRPTRSATRARGHAGPCDRGCRRTQPLLPDLWHRSGGISLKTLNQASRPTELKQLCCSTAIQSRRQKAGLAEKQGGQKKAQPQKNGCAEMILKFASGGRNQREDLFEPQRRRRSLHSIVER